MRELPKAWRIFATFIFPVSNAQDNRNDTLIATLTCGDVVVVSWTWTCLKTIHSFKAIISTRQGVVIFKGFLVWCSFFDSYCLLASVFKGFQGDVWWVIAMIDKSATARLVRVVIVITFRRIVAFVRCRTSSRGIVPFNYLSCRALWTSRSYDQSTCLDHYH